MGRCSKCEVHRQIEAMFRVRTDSPLRRPPQPISEQQIVLLDGIRYSADMAGIAIDRLWDQLCFLDSTEETVEAHHIAAAALDAWSVIDAAHRMHDLIENLPGLPNSPWRRIFRQRMADALAQRHVATSSRWGPRHCTTARASMGCFSLGAASRRPIDRVVVLGGGGQ